MSNRERIINLFHAVKQRGFVTSHRRNNTGIGKTFEDLIGVEENNIDAPDLLGYEIKSHREDAESYVTLFTKAPSFPLRANRQLLAAYGEIEKNGLKKLHTSMFATAGNTYRGLYSFQLENDRGQQRILIVVRNLQTGEEIDRSTGYTYKDIENCLDRKLHNLFYVEAETEKQGEEERFYFHSADIYEEPSMERFLEMVDNGLIMYDIRMGMYGSGKNQGNPHDHGSGFRVKACNLKQLYAQHYDVE